MRFDFALRLANELEIDVNEICSASHFSGDITEEEIYPTLSNGLSGALDGESGKNIFKEFHVPAYVFFWKKQYAECG